MRIAVLVGIGTVALALVDPLGAAPVPKHLQKAPEIDRGKLQGKWKVEALQLGGKNVLAARQKFDIAVEFRGDGLFAVADLGGGPPLKLLATVKHDPKGGSRFTLTDLRTLDRDDQPADKLPDRDEVFGYAFDGDKLLVAAVSGAGGKQVADPLKPGSDDIVLVLVRVK
jgi:uncharacterized protein (TIGR03067 family)